MAKKKISRMRAAYSVAPVLKAKKRPRGKPFKRGNRIGAATRFQPGQSGNAGGRPRSAEVSKASRAWLAEKVTATELRANQLPNELLGCTHAEVIAYVQGQDAMRGNLGSAEFVTDRAEGKPHTSLSINEGPNPLIEYATAVRELSERIGPPEQPALPPDPPKQPKLLNPVPEVAETSVDDALENEEHIFTLEAIDEN
jgi:hypothetical protein